MALPVTSEQRRILLYRSLKTKNRDFLLTMVQSIPINSAFSAICRQGKSWFERMKLYIFLYIKKMKYC